MTLNEFLASYEYIELVKSSKNYENLFDSMCFLIKNESENPKTISAISSVLENYVTIESVKNEKTGINVLQIDFSRVPRIVAESINKRAIVVKRHINADREAK